MNARSRIAAAVQNEAFLVVVLLLTAAFNSVVVLVTPYVGGRIVQAIATGTVQSLWLYTLWMVAGLVFAGIGSSAESYLSTLLSERVGKVLRLSVFRHLMHVPLQFVSSRETGELMNRVDSDIDLLMASFVAGIEPLFSSFLGLFVMLTVMIAMDWRLTLIAAVTVPVWTIATLPASQKISDLRMRMIRAKDRLDTRSSESLGRSGLTIVKSFAAFREAIARFSESVDELINVRLAAAMYTRVLQSGLSVVGAAGPAILLLGGAWLAFHGQTSVAAIVTFLSLQGRLIAPIAQLANLRLNLATARGVADRMDEILSEPIERGGDIRLVVRGELAVRDLAYEIEDQPVLRAVSFSAPAGASIALVGPSGAGKTTLLQIVAGLYRPKSGVITFDGISSEKIDLESLRSKVVLVPQHCYFFTDTILNNMRLARASASAGEIVAVLGAMKCMEFIESSSNGLDSVIGAGALKLSGGELQRLAIARALLAEPRVLLLDEATSAMDPEVEGLVLEAIYAKEDLTIIHATHRPERLPRVDATVYLGTATKVCVL